MGVWPIIFIFQLPTNEALSSYTGQFVKIGVVFHAPYFKNKVGDPPPPQFFFISDIGNSLPDCSKNMKKICVVEDFNNNNNNNNNNNKLY